ncbi:MAG: ribosomal-processing cysteine protease Prp [Bacilli bacterium]|nr:ribosomal-processing cysteine protease Prp [Bacilli bacterium]
MIRVLVKSSEVLAYEIKISGHSGYAEAGADIICSAVSSAMYLTLGLIEKVCPKYDYTSDEKKPLMKLDILETNDITDLIVTNLISYLQSISESYADYLQIKIEK